MVASTQLPPLVFFDLDGTLAESKQALTPSTAHYLSLLMAKTRVAVVSGGALPQFLTQIVAQLPANATLSNLYLLPTSGGALYEHSGDSWQKVYEERLSDSDATKIEEVLQAALSATHVIDLEKQSWGERIEYRGAQISLSALGQQAPPAEKRAWDPSHEKRHALVDYLTPRLPAYSVALGGLTTIDVTKRGIDKAYGIRKLCERLSLKESDVLYIGDELEAGGNDEAVYKTNAQVRPVSSVAETEHVILDLLSI